MEKIKWGIIGLGNIASKFAEALSKMEEVELAAVASRSKEKSLAFGEKFGVAKDKCYGNYNDLVSDKEIDAVYIALPISHHKENTILALKHKKAVLCEKTIALNTKETEAMIQAAKENNSFFMEAMWTRFLPLYTLIKNKINEGVIGELRMIQADFGISRPLEADGVKMNAALGGGAMYDLGIYPVNFCSIIFDENPLKIKSIASMSSTGVDLQTIVNFGYKDEKVASFCCSLNADTPGRAFIMGSKGKILVENYWRAEKAVIFYEGREETIEAPFEINGFEYEIREVVRCLNQGKIESDTMSWDKSIEMMKIMDRIRSDWQ